MLHDPAFWVAGAFVCFVGMAGRPLFRKLYQSLRDYQREIIGDLEEAERGLKKAQEVWNEARKKSQETQKTMEEIQQWSQERLQHRERVFEETIEQMHQENKRILSSHQHFSRLQLEKDLKSRMLQRMVQQAKDVLGGNPLGLPERLLIEFSGQILLNASPSTPGKGSQGASKKVSKGLSSPPETGCAPVPPPKPSSKNLEGKKRTPKIKTRNETQA
jgi:F0F1-type ATP synthase membrane subunit b/b'